MRQTAVITVVLIVALAVIAFFLSSFPPPPPKLPPEPPVRGQHVQIGETVIVGDLNSDDTERTICMVRDLADVPAVQAMVAARDEEGMRQFLGYNRAVLVPNRSKAKLLEIGPEYCRIRTLTGGQRGKEGWLPPEFLLREPWP